jgi:hypothetical protein
VRGRQEGGGKEGEIEGKWKEWDKGNEKEVAHTISKATNVLNERGKTSNRDSVIHL